MKNLQIRALACCLAGLVLIAACSRESTTETTQAESKSTNATAIGQIDDLRINNASSEPGNWLAHGLDYKEQRFSPLKQINKQTIGGLGLAFEVDLGSNDALEATPIMVDGTLFFTSTYSIVHAVDAKTGAEKWRYDPQVPKEFLRRACCGPINRGVAVYQGNVYVATLDGRLVAVNATSGAKVWEVNTIVDAERNYSITGAPRAAKGKIFIGNGGAEFGVRGYASAYDSTTGDLVWRMMPKPARSSGVSTPSPATLLYRSNNLSLSSRQPPGKAVSGGRSAAAVPSGTPLSMIRISTRSSSASVTAHRGRALSALLVVATTCSSPVSSHLTPTPAKCAGTTRPFPATTGTTPRCRT